MVCSLVKRYGKIVSNPLGGVWTCKKVESRCFSSPSSHPSNAWLHYWTVSTDFISLILNDIVFFLLVLQLYLYYFAVPSIKTRKIQEAKPRLVKRTNKPSAKV